MDAFVGALLPGAVGRAEAGGDSEALLDLPRLCLITSELRCWLLSNGGSLREYNAVRAIYYGRNNWAAGAFRDRIREVVPALAVGPIGSINDAIEAHQSRLTLKDIPELFDTEELPALLEQASKAFGNACRYANTFLHEKGIIHLYDELEQRYAKQFWELLGTCGAEKNINGDELKTLLAEHPNCLGPVLEMPAFVKRFDQDISKSMMEVPRASAELIISALATDSRGQQPIHLPPVPCE